MNLNHELALFTFPVNTLKDCRNDPFQINGNTFREKDSARFISAPSSIGLHSQRKEFALTRANSFLYERKS